MCGMIWLFFSRGMDFKKKLLNSLTSCLKVNWGQITRYSIICYSKLTFRNPFIYIEVTNQNPNLKTLPLK